MRTRIGSFEVSLLAVALASVATLGVAVAVGTAPFAQDENATTAATAGPATTTETSDLDLREANVVGVTVESVGDGRYDVSVTLYHDDDGEAGYANWWQVEALNGTELGRRDLLHAHGTEPFTRSTRVAVPGNVSLVVVRGHDQTHGYGGQAMVVAVATGATEAVRQGPEPRDFGDCEVVRRDAWADGTTTGASDETVTEASDATATETSDATATETSDETASGPTATNETDLVRCPWEEPATTAPNRTA